MIEPRHVQGRGAVTEDTRILAPAGVEGKQLLAGHADLMLPEQERIDRSLRAGYGFAQRLELADMQHLGGLLFDYFNEKRHCVPTSADFAIRLIPHPCSLVPQSLQNPASSSWSALWHPGHCRRSRRARKCCAVISAETMPVGTASMPQPISIITDASARPKSVRGTTSP